MAYNDTAIFDLIKKETKRQKEGLELIPSENYASKEVLEALGSVFVDKYAEGYPGKRYYAGTYVVDEVERLCQDRAKKLFKVPHVNVQPYSGSPANLAVYMATCKPGDVIMGLNLPDGGHLTHGWTVSATAIFYKSYSYHVKADGYFDYDEILKLAKQHKPKLIWTGATAYPFKYDYAKFAEIADSVGAFLAADIAHVAGLIAAGVHPDPAPYAHIITTTTHKTLRGPRGGMIMVTEKGLKKDPDLADKIDKAVFPGLQGGPHENQVAAIAVALKEASSPEFKKYGRQIIKNSQALAKALIKKGIKLVAGGTENHLMLLDLVPIFGPGGGIFVQEALEIAHITTNKNTIPKDPSTPFYPSGLRIGSPAITSRGMKEAEMKKVADWIARVIEAVSNYKLPSTTKEDRQAYIVKFKDEIKNNKALLVIRKEINIFTKDFPVPGIN